MYENEIEELTPVLGSDFATQYTFTKHDLFTLRTRWRTYQKIFGTNEERFNLVFKISKSVAQTLEQTLFEATLLGLRRITDPVNSKGKKRSVSIKSFSHFLEGAEQNEMKRMASEAERAASFARNWSDKRIAHADLDYREGRVRLKPASRKKVNEAIDAVAKPIKWIASNKLDTTLVTHPTSPANDEVWFLRNLFEGQKELARKRKLRIELIRQGKLDERRQLDNYPEWLNFEKDIFDVE